MIAMKQGAARRVGWLAAVAGAFGMVASAVAEPLKIAYSDGAPARALIRPAAGGKRR